MTKGLTKRIQQLEKQVKNLQKIEEVNKIAIGKIIKHLKTSQGNLFRLDIIQFALSKVLVKNKLTTNKKIDKICNNKREEVLKEREELIKKKQEEKNKENKEEPKKIAKEVKEVKKEK